MPYLSASLFLTIILELPGSPCLAALPAACFKILDDDATKVVHTCNPPFSFTTSLNFISVPLPPILVAITIVPGFIPPPLLIDSILYASCSSA